MCAKLDRVSCHPCWGEKKRKNSSFARAIEMALRDLASLWDLFFAL